MEAAARKKSITVGLPLFSVVLICLFSCAFLFFRNAGEAKAVDILPFFGVFLLTACPIFLFTLLLTRGVARAAILTDIAMLVVENFTLICNGIKRVIPGFHNIYFLGAFALIWLLLLILLMKKKPDLSILCGLIVLGFGCVLLMNFFFAIPTMISTARNHQSDYQMNRMPGAPNPPPSGDEAPGEGEASNHTRPEDLYFTEEKRNFYYFLFDEYAGSACLERYYGDDNEAFLTALEDRGFSVSRTSKNPESPWTMTLIPNMMNLGYVVDDEMEIKNRMERMENPGLYQLFRGNGYQINLLNQYDFLGAVGCNVLSSSQRRETISMYAYRNSVFCQIPWLKDQIEHYVLHGGDNTRYRRLMQSFDMMKSCWQYAGKQTLTVSYLQCPHIPFAVDEAGDPVPPELYDDWRIPELYLGQLKYLNGVILETVDQIQKNDPNAVIVLVADHGARTPGHLVNRYGGPLFDIDEETPYMQNVLCCVYTPGQKLDIEGDTCINATRKVLDAVYGTNLGLLEVPPSYKLSEKDCFGPYWGNG